MPDDFAVRPCRLEAKLLCYFVIISCVSLKSNMHFNIMGLSFVVSFFSNKWDDLRFYDLFNSLSVISRRREVDNERLCAMDPV